MARLRPAVAELALGGAVLMVGGVAISVAGFVALSPADRRTGLIPAVVLAALIVVVGLALNRGEDRAIATQARPAGDDPVAAPGLLALTYALVVGAAVVALVLLDLELDLFGALVAGLGAAQLIRAARLRSLERSIGRRILVQADARWLWSRWSAPEAFRLR